MTYYLGMADSEDADRPMREAALRVDLDPETGAGAVGWLPEGLIGVEDGYEPRALRVCESSATDLVEVPASIGRVSYRGCTRGHRTVHRHRGQARQSGMGPGLNEAPAMSTRSHR